MSNPLEIGEVNLVIKDTKFTEVATVHKVESAHANSLPVRHGDNVKKALERLTPVKREYRDYYGLDDVINGADLAFILLVPSLATVVLTIGAVFNAIDYGAWALNVSWIASPILFASIASYRGNPNQRIGRWLNRLMPLGKSHKKWLKEVDQRNFEDRQLEILRDVLVDSLEEVKMGELAGKFPNGSTQELT